jgi:hypothetical protein
MKCARQRGFDQASLDSYATGYGVLTRPGLNALKEGKRHSMVVAMPFPANHLVELGYLKNRR